MGKVHFESSGSLGVLTLANPPLNLFSGELIEDLRTALNQAKQLPLHHVIERGPQAAVVVVLKRHEAEGL